MLSFQNDYQEGAHEKILARLIETNLEPLSGYGSDPYCESAKKKIQTACECPEADVWFLTGGTQTNQTIIDTMLEPMKASFPPRPAMLPPTKQVPSNTADTKC